MDNHLFRTLDQLTNIDGKRVLVRVDFNVPLHSETEEISDPARITGALPTITTLLDKGASVILVSHRGRPKEWSEADSLRPIAEYLGTQLSSPVAFVSDIAGDEALRSSRALRPGEVLVLENVRFDKREETNDREFARALANLADVYVNDAFGTAHRRHASIVGVSEFLPAYAGRLMETELRVLSEILSHPDRPYWGIIGGSKVSDKVLLLDRLLDSIDGLVIGGGMANTFLVAQGYNLGVSKVEESALSVAKEILQKAKSRDIPILLPTDVVVATAFREDALSRVVNIEDIRADEMALDVGPRTVKQVIDTLSTAKTVLWNGPMGVFEWDTFAQGTLGIARALAGFDAKVVVGGGDSAAAAKKASIKDQLTHVSTGGGATLEFLEGKILPGVQVLMMEEGKV